MGTRAPEQAVRALALPYGLRNDELVLDSGAVNSDTVDTLDALRDLVADQRSIVHLPEEDLRRVLLSAVLLLDAGAGTVAECLVTALIWERG